MTRQKQAHHQLKERKSGITPHKRLSSKDPLQVYVAGKLINAAVGHKYLGLWLDSTLNMNEHLRRMLNAEIKLLSRVRRSLTVLPPKRYTLRISCRHVATMLYCSMPVVRVSDTMSKKFDSV